MDDKTYRMQLIEVKRGMPLEELLPRLFEEHGTQTAVARELGLSPMALATWLKDLGAQVKSERFVRHKTTVTFPNYTPVR